MTSQAGKITANLNANDVFLNTPKLYAYYIQLDFNIKHICFFKNRILPCCKVINGFFKYSRWRMTSVFVLEYFKI